MEPLKINGMFGCPRSMYAMINMPVDLHIQGFLTNCGPRYTVSRSGFGIFGSEFITEQELNSFIISWNRKEKLKRIQNVVS